MSTFAVVLSMCSVCFPIPIFNSSLLIIVSYSFTQQEIYMSWSPGLERSSFGPTMPLIFGDHYTPWFIGMLNSYSSANCLLVRAAYLFPYLRDNIGWGSDQSG